MENTLIPSQIPLENDDFEVLEDELLPPVDEFKRFMSVFFRRKIVIFGFALVVVMVLMAVFADFIAPYGPYEQDLMNVLADPTPAHPFGTDSLGRDLLSRIIFGSRVALIVGVVCTFVSAAIGTTIGLIAGFAEGVVNDVIMRLTDAIMAVPGLILTLLICGVLGNGMFGVIIAVSVGMFPGYIRLVNGQVLSVKLNDYVLAERAMGTKRARIILKHILPNVLSPLIVMMTMMMGGAVMSEAMLSFLGIGLLPPTAAWGAMCFNGYKYLLTKPLLSIAPGLAIMLLVFGLNMVGDGIRDALDPRLRGTTSN
jgi:ABC-type dipeptide/oligopeptide/nickel transport system permease subunit